MFVILWEFEVKPGSEAGFEKVYGPTGEWVQLFQQDPCFRGTKLLRDVSRPGHFYTIDSWESSYRQFLVRLESAYQRSDHSAERLTLQERKLLSCELGAPLGP